MSEITTAYSTDPPDEQRDSGTPHEVIVERIVAVLLDNARGPDWQLARYRLRLRRALDTLDSETLYALARAWDVEFDDPDNPAEPDWDRLADGGASA